VVIRLPRPSIRRRGSGADRKSDVTLKCVLRQCKRKLRGATTTTAARDDDDAQMTGGRRVFSLQSQNRDPTVNQLLDGGRFLPRKAMTPSESVAGDVR
jgi:hypothetical protein